MGIQRYTIEGMTSYTTCNEHGTWCISDDVDELESENTRLKMTLSQTIELGGIGEKRIGELHADLEALSNAVVRAESILDNDLYRTRVKNAYTELSEVKDIAVNWLPDPPSC